MYSLQRRIPTIWRAFCAERKIDTYLNRENYHALRAGHSDYTVRFLTGHLDYTVLRYTFILYFYNSVSRSTSGHLRTVIPPPTVGNLGEPS